MLWIKIRRCRYDKLAANTRTHAVLFLHAHRFDISFGQSVD